MNYLLIIGLLMNCITVCLNRFWKHLPDHIYIPLLMIGIGCMIAGAFLSKAA